VKTTTSSCCSTTPAAPDPLRIERFEGDRTPLLPLFELADDSRVLLESYLDDGDVLVARDGDDILGHLQLVDTDDADTLEIKNMAVAIARQGSGIGRALVEGALEQARLGGATRVLVATGAADVGNLRFYQRLGFRMLSVERDVFTPAFGYPAGLEVDGIPLRDRVWLDQDV
jgi:GNAT superfamily N-acetyltransferase